MEMNQMPVDTIEEILVRLPVKTLLRFKCVCRQWRDLIESRRFVDRHYSHDSNRDRLIFRRLYYKIEGEQFEEEGNGDAGDGDGDGVNLNLGYFVKYEHRMGPVNGVFCEVGTRGTIVLLNPATRKAKRLPSLPPLPRRRRLEDLRFGFGSDRSTGDYKTVAFYRGEFACVYSVSSECWRFIEGVDASSVGHLVWGGYCNGVCYWVCQGILAFDTITEKFREIEPPPGFVGKEMNIHFGGGDESRVFFVCRSFWLLSDVWALEIVNGNICWSKIFSTFPPSSSPSPSPSSFPNIPKILPIHNDIFWRWIPVCVWKNEVVCGGCRWKVVEWWKDEEMVEKGMDLIAVDISTHKVRQLRLSQRDCSLEALPTAFSYKDTLLSFKS